MGTGDIYYTVRHAKAGLPPPEKWKGLEIAKSVGMNGYTVDTFTEDSKKMIGFEVMDGIMSNKLTPPLDEYIIEEFTYIYGDDNPLYTDPDYANNTRYGCLIAPPTILNSLKYPVCRGVLDWGPYPLAGFPSGVGWEWYDVIRVHDRFRCSMKLDEVYEKKGRTGKLIFTNVDLSIWNQRNNLVATGESIFISVGREGYVKGEGFTGDRGMLYERPTYSYSKEEIEKIIEGIEGEERRGSTPRYWEDVNVGDKLTPVIHGPQTFVDFLVGELGTQLLRGREIRVAYPSFEYGRAFSEETVRKNPVTGWPYEPRWMEHYDFNLCKGRGLPGPFDLGVCRASQNIHLISNWMGDDGFLKKLTSSIRKPFYYGDTNWFSGEVVDKYIDKVSGEEYAAVDIIINAMNEVGENDLPGKASIYLPSRELGEVKLPIPIPSEEEWKVITKRDVNDFIREIDSGDTIFPWLPSEMENYTEWVASQRSK